jgi:hypothetical protein
MCDVKKKNNRWEKGGSLDCKKGMGGTREIIDDPRGDSRKNNSSL